VHEFPEAPQSREHALTGLISYLDNLSKPDLLDGLGQR
jgi:hypothetical protein